MPTTKRLTPPVTARLATTRDCRELLDLMVDFNRHEHIPFDRRRVGRALRTLLAHPEIGVVVLAHQPPVRPAIGYFIVTWGFDLEWHGRDSFLTELYLAPQARGRGLGTALMHAVLATARAGGARAIHLMVRPDNRAARALYARAGFESPGRLLLSLPLAAAATPAARTRPRASAPRARASSPARRPARSRARRRAD